MSLFDEVLQVHTTERNKGGLVEFVYLSRRQPDLKEMLSEETKSADGRIWGIPLHVSEAMPQGMGMLRTSCRCTPGEVMADGGGFMHEAKQHTVILKFGDEAA